MPMMDLIKRSFVEMLTYKTVKVRTICMGVYCVCVCAPQQQGEGERFLFRFIVLFFYPQGCSLTNCKSPPPHRVVRVSRNRSECTQTEATMPPRPHPSLLEKTNYSW